MLPEFTGLAALTVRQTAALYRKKKLSPVEALKDLLMRIEAAPPEINAFTFIRPDEALKGARASERRHMKGQALGPLDGIFATVKSNIARQGWPMRRGTLTSSDTPMAFSAPAVASLERAGAVFYAQTTMPEFGWIGHGNSPLTGVTRNPHDVSRTTGGSSAGAAAAAALRLGHLHLGTDGAGSVRIPASFCGVFGLKPTFGRVPAFPASPYGSIAHIGPLTASVADAALMLNAIAQPDSRDMLGALSPPPDFTKGLNAGVKGLRIAWSPRLGFVERAKIDPEVAAACAAAAKTFSALGAPVEEADPDLKLEEVLNPLEVLWQAGSAAVLNSVPEEKRGLIGRGFLGMAKAGRKHSAADFAVAQAARAVLWNRMRAFHERYDLLLTPSMPLPAIEAGRDLPSGKLYGPSWLDWSPFSYPFNLTMQPAASINCGFTRSGLPIGLQIVGPLGADALVLRAAAAFEAAMALP